MKLANLPIILGLALLALAVPAAIFLSTQKGIISLRTKAGQDKTAVIYIWPAEAQGKLGESIPVKVFLATEGSEIKEAIVKITYDSDVLQLTSVDNGVIFQRYTDKTIDNQAGVAEIKTQGSFNGSGSLATLNFLAKKKSTAQINPLLDDSAATDASGNNLLQGVNGGVVTVN